MITVVMLNWARPQYALLNLRRYSAYSIVRQILCFNNGAPLIRRAQLPPKCVLVEASSDLGVASRLAVASLATTEAIFHTDDDLCVPESTLAALYHAWTGAKLSCHGLFGRVAYPAYTYGNILGPAEVILTRALVCSRRVNNTALSVIDLFHDLEGRPRGNGEDILLSFAGMALSKKLNFAYPVPAVDYPGCDASAIHKRWAGHLAHRRKMVSRCRRVFFNN